MTSSAAKRDLGLLGRVSTEPPTLVDPMVGKVIAGRYQILDKVGEGGGGSVYLAEHMLIGRLMAFKVLRTVHAMDEAQKERFRREARVASFVRHRCIVEVTDAGELDDGRPFIVMEYLSGGALSDRLSALRDLPFQVARSLLTPVAEALSAAHEAGVVHRDLKPENLLFSDDGELLKIADFGLACLTDAPKDDRLTRDGHTVGTPAYMAPEQVRGEPPTDRVDVYAIGCILFEFVTGRTLFEGLSAVETMMAHLNDVPPRITEIAGRPVPSDICDLVDACLRKNADERPPMVEVALRLSPDELEGALDPPDLDTRVDLRAETADFDEEQHINSLLGVAAANQDSLEPEGESGASMMADLAAITGSRRRSRLGMVAVAALSIPPLMWWALTSDAPTVPAPPTPAPVAATAPAAETPPPIVAPAPAPVVPTAPPAAAAPAATEPHKPPRSDSSETRNAESPKRSDVAAKRKKNRTRRSAPVRKKVEAASARPEPTRAARASKPTPAPEPKAAPAPPKPAPKTQEPKPELKPF